MRLVVSNDDVINVIWFIIIYALPLNLYSLDNFLLGLLPWTVRYN